MLLKAVWVTLAVLCNFIVYTTESTTTSHQLEAKYPIVAFVGERPITTALEGSDVTLHCSINCDDCGRRRQQWNDVKLSWLEDSRETVSAIGSDSVLLLRNVTTAQQTGRVYRCVASIGNWSAVGIERHVVVYKKAKVLLRPFTQNLSIGGIAVLQCTQHATRNNQLQAASRISWHKDGIQLATNASGSHAVKYGMSQIGGYLVIRGLQLGDAGKYTCVAYSELAKGYVVSNQALVIISTTSTPTALPQFTHKPPTNQRVAINNPASILCSAFATPLPRVTIYFQPLGFMETAKPVASGIGCANVSLASVQSSNAGKYECKAVSSDVAVTHESRLTVLSPPSFIETPQPRKLTISDVTLTLTCDAAGNPIPEIAWYKNGTRIRSTSTSEGVPFSADVTDDGNGRLTINSPKAAKDTGIYQCFASNEVSTIQHSTFVFLESLVRPPVNVEAEALSPSAIRVKWEANPLNNENAILAHIVVYEDTLSAPGDQRKDNVLQEITLSEFKINELFGGTEYAVYLITYAKNGLKSQKSQVVKAKTLEGVPGIAPQPIKAVNFGNKTIRVTWQPIPRKHANGIITEYKIRYGITGFFMREVRVSAPSTHVDIHNLNIGELYMIEVAASTSAGFGVAEKTTIKVGNAEIAGQIGPPLVLHTTGEASQIFVQWSSLNKASLITGLELSYIPVLSAYYWHDIRKVQLSASSRSYTMRRVDRSKMYRVELRIQSGPVISRPSIAVYMPGKRSAIPNDLQLLKVSNPRDLKCAVRDNTSIFLTWNKPALSSDVDDYTVHVVHGGRIIERLQIPHTREQKYLLKNVTPGTWYYARVRANPKRNRVVDVRRQLKRAFVVPEYYSKVVACKTAEEKPGRPNKLLCSVSANAHFAKITWYPPERAGGLITKYIIGYREKSLRLTAEWSVHEYELKPSSDGFPYVYTLLGDYYKRYELNVTAVNSAGRGPPAVVSECAFRRKKVDPAAGKGSPGASTDDSHLMSEDTKLGVIVGCSVASFFIFIFVIVFIWKNPFRVKTTSANSNQGSVNTAVPSGVSPEDFLYLQRLADLQNSLSQDVSDSVTRYSSDNKTKSSNGRSKADNRGSINQSEPLMPKHMTSIELTGSSSGPTVCTCTCLLHGRLRGQSILKPSLGLLSSPQHAGRRGEQENDCHANHSSSSHSSGDIDSVESADSRTQMLPKSDVPAHAHKGPTLIPVAKVTVQQKRETTFQV